MRCIRMGSIRKRGAIIMYPKKGLLEHLQSVLDPELRCSIVDLGLIYDVWVKDSIANVTMTLTTPLCPLAPQMQHDITQRLKKLPGISEVKIELVWEPVWDPSTMASDEIKDMLGLW